MDINVTSNEYKVISSGTVAAFNDQSDITFHFNGTDFKFDLKILFEKTDSEKIRINRTINEDEIIFECENFDDAGAGTSAPVELATYQGEKVYIRFWSYLEGDVSNQQKTRKIEYTFFLGR